MIVILEDIIGIIECIWVSVSLFGFDTISSSEDGLVIISEVSISTVGWLKSFIVMSCVEGCSATSWPWFWLWSSTEVSG